MLRARTLASIVIALLVTASAAWSHPRPGGKSREGSKDSAGGEKFDDVVKDLETIEGLFTFYHDADENRFYMEILPEQLDRIYLCSTAREAGDGLFYDSGSMSGSFPFVLEKVGKTIRFVHRNVYYRALPDMPISGAIERGLTNSVLGIASLKAEPHEDRGSFLVDPGDFFLKDHHAVATSLKHRAEVDYSLDEEGSYFSRVRSFPENSEVETVLHFTAGSRARPGCGSRTPAASSTVTASASWKSPRATTCRGTPTIVSGTS